MPINAVGVVVSRELAGQCIMRIVIEVNVALLRLCFGCTQSDQLTIELA